MSIVIKNNASNFLADGINASQTTIDLQSAASFPSLSAGEYFYGTIESISGQIEIVKVTNITGNTLTVVRAQEGTSAASFVEGSRFELRINVGSVEGATYTPAGSSSVGRTLQTKLQESVSVKDFGAVGDGSTDDVSALEAAILYAGNNDLVLVWPEGNYFVSRGIGGESVQIGALAWDCQNATITLDPTASHQTAVVYYRLTAGANNTVKGSGLNINANDKANVGFAVRQNDNDRTGSFYGEQIHVENVERSNTLPLGAGIYIRGGYRDVELFKCSAKEIHLPPGQGTPGTIGVTGIFVGRGLLSGEPGTFPLDITIDSCYVDHVYSSDLAYTADQDGCVLFGDNGTVASEFCAATITNCVFKNCRGRSIKTQIEKTTVENCKFQGESSVIDQIANVVIDVQHANAIINNCSLTTDVNTSFFITISDPSFADTKPRFDKVSNCDVFVSSGATLNEFCQIWNSLSSQQKPIAAIVDNVFIRGAVDKVIVGRSAQTDYNNFTVSVSNVFVTEVNTYFTELNTSGASGLGYFSFNNCRNYGTSVVLLRDQIPGVSARASVSSLNVYGFSPMQSFTRIAEVEHGGMLQISGLSPEVSPTASSGSFKMYGAARLDNGESTTFSLHGLGRGLMFITNSLQAGSQGVFSYSSNAGVVEVSAGSDIVAGGLSEPATGLAKVWYDGTNIVLKNEASGNPAEIMVAFLG